MSEQGFTDSVTITSTERKNGLQARHKGVGASESAALFDLSPWNLAVLAWAKKTGPVETTRRRRKTIRPSRTPPPSALTGATARGAIAERFQKRTQAQALAVFRPRHRLAPADPVMFASVEVNYRGAPTGRAAGHFEIKNSADYWAWIDGPPQ